LRAELLAAQDALPIERRRPRWIPAVAIAAVATAAAAGGLVVARRAERPVVAVVRAASAPRPASALDAGPDPAASEPPGVEPARAEVIGTIDVESNGARFERAGDVVRISEGALRLDTRGRHTTEVVAGAARIAVSDAEVRVQVRGGRLMQVQVLAGAAALDVGGRVRVVSAGELWRAPTPARSIAAAPVPTAPRPIAPSAPNAIATAPVLAAPRPIATAPEPSAPEPIAPEPPGGALPRSSPGAVQAFRLGWEALRAGQFHDAIAAFDRARDPAVAEDASYWAAVAAARAGDRDEARRRLRAFLVAFPGSPHADEARDALAR
jgi:hypothetical protein